MIEQAEYRGKVVDANRELKKLEALTDYTDPEHAMTSIIEVSNALSNALDAAMGTSDKNDDARVEASIKKAVAKIEELVDVLPVSGFQRDLLKKYGPARIMVGRVLGMKPLTGIHVEIARNSLKNLTQIVEDLETQNPQAGKIARGDEQKIANKIVESADKLPTNKKIGNKDLQPAISDLLAESSILQNVADQQEVAAWLKLAKELSDDAIYADQENEKVSANTSVISGQELTDFMNHLRQVYRTPEQIKFLNTFELLLQQAQHEHSVTAAGRTDKDQRDLLRPSMDAASIPSELRNGPAEEFASHFAADLREAEAIALKVALEKPDQRTNVVPEADRTKLLNFKHKLMAYASRQSSFILSAAGKGMISTADNAKLIQLTNYTNRYIAWIERVLDVTEDPALLNRTPGTITETDNGDRSDYDEQLKASIASAMHDFITNSWPPTDRLLYNKAFERREKQLRSENMGDLADAIAFTRTLHEFGILTATESGTLNIANLTVKPEAAFGALKSQQEGLAFYDRLRDTDVFKTIVNKLTHTAYIEMLDPESTYFAGKSWETANALMDVMFDRLYTGDAIFKAAIDEFPEKDEFRDDVIKLFKRLAQYDASLRDLRTKAAAVALGVNKSAFKHYDGQAIEPWGLPAQIAYKVGKNKDMGSYATALNWMVLPKEFYIGYGKNDAEAIAARAEHAANLHDREHDFDHFIEETFDKAAVRELKKRRWKIDARYNVHPAKAADPKIPPDFGGFPTFDDFLSHPVKELIKDPKTGQMIEARAADNSADNFKKAQDNTQKIYELANNSWKEKITYEKDPGEFYIQVTKYFSDMGSILSQAYSTATNDESVKQKIYESLEAACNFYIVYLLGQIPRDPKKFIDLEYRRKYNLFKQAALSYINSNNSLLAPRKGDKPFSFKESFTKTVESKAFRKKYVFAYETRKLIPYNRDRLQKLKINPNFAPLADLTRHVEYPFQKKSSKSSREGEEEH